MNPIFKYINRDVNLFDNQKDNVRALVGRRKAILSDKVGSGKTLSVLYSFCYLKSKGYVDRLVVLTPKSADDKEVWKKDIQKFTKLKSLHLDTLFERAFTKKSLDNILGEYDVFYGRHTLLNKYLDEFYTILSDNRTIFVVDEIHAFKNPRTQIANNFRVSTFKCSNIWGMTGTILSKDLTDMYNIVNLVSPYYLGSFVDFKNNFCLVNKKVVGKKNGRLVRVDEIIGIKNQDYLNKYLDPLVIRGESFVDVAYHYIDYSLSPYEATLYEKIAKGINIEADNDEDWLKKALSQQTLEDKELQIKEVARHSSRFIYLQSAADGIITEDGVQSRTSSTKLDKLYDLVKSLVSRGRSCLIYFDYYVSLNAAEQRLKGLKAKIVKSTGETPIDSSKLNEKLVKAIPHIVLCTRASAESVSYYFIGDVILFHIPTVPHTFVQFIGRITRRNTLFHNDLHCHIFRSENIDLYKILVVTNKVTQMEAIQGEELNVPNTYKDRVGKDLMIDHMKKVLLWNRY